MSFDVRARAKLNLFLNVVGRRPDGYHLLDSLFVFVDLSDRLSGKERDNRSFSVSGEFAKSVSTDGDNLVLKAVDLMSKASGLQRHFALHLEKNIPVAAGLGGGSVDAAAILNALNEEWNLHWSLDRLMPLAQLLGADVPACLGAKPAIVTGIGDVLHSAPSLPQFSVLLINPRVPTATPAVFRQFASFNPVIEAKVYSPLPNQWGTLSSFAKSLAERGNDLLPAALSVTPVIAEVLSALRDAPDTACSGLSGSGATCFALYETDDAARRAGKQILQSHPEWWGWWHGKRLK